MALKQLESYPAGGVSSRDNPISYPLDRYLRMVNFWPQQDGSLRLRDGYTLYAQGLPDVPIHSIIGVVGPGPAYARLTVFWQGKIPYILDPATKAITAATVRGATIKTSDRFCYFYTPGKLYAFNGTDSKWFDGVVWRDIGLPSAESIPPPPSQAKKFIDNGFEFVHGVPELSTAQAVAVGVAAGSGGSFVADKIGRLVFVVLAGTALGVCELGPATISVGSGSKVKLAANQQINLTGLPNLTSLKLPADAKLLAISEDGGSIGHFCVDTSASVDSWAYVGYPSNTVTVQAPGHGCSTGDIVIMPGSSARPEWTVFVVTVIDLNQFSIKFPSNFDSLPALPADFAPTSVKRIVRGGTVTGTSASILASTVDTSYAVSAPRGISPSTIGGEQPGYLFFGSAYARLAGGHVGNHGLITSSILIKATQSYAGPTVSDTSFTSVTSLNRVLPTVRTNFWIHSLVTQPIGGFHPIYPEVEWLFGRSSDGGQVPHAILDTAGGNQNWLSSIDNACPFSPDCLLISGADIDGNAQLPERNFPPPGTLDFNQQIAPDAPIVGTFKRAWVESDHCCGTLEGQPTVYRSGSAQDSREGKFVGLPEQRWSPADIETFPTASPVTGGHGYSGESLVFSSEDSGTLIELAGETGWQGPYNIGGAGQFAYAKGWKNLPFSLTGEKQLATGSPDGPTPISDEYEQALLSKIGDQYLGDAEIVPVRLPHKRVDVLRISARDKDGNPYTVIHDFNLRDNRSPYGQAYQEGFLGPLGSPATFAAVRDENDQPLILAGASDGNLYKLYDSISDDGEFFTGEALGLRYIGPQRTAIKFLEWYGDGNAKFFVSKKLTTAFDFNQMQALCPTEDKSAVELQGDEESNHYQVPVEDPEMIHAYVLLRLTGYPDSPNPADLNNPIPSTMELSDPPHMPVETYGRILLVSPSAGAGRP